MDFGDFLWSLLIIYFIFFYFIVLFRILRRPVQRP